MQTSARVLLFIDYQNVHLGALRAFWPANTSPARGHVNPRALGELVVAKRAANGFPSELREVRVYRGRPEPTRAPRGAAANDRQAEAWSRLGKVRVIRRPLRHPRKWPAEPAQEKGVDVALAVDMVRLAIQGAYDVGVLVSADRAGAGGRHGARRRARRGRGVAMRLLDGQRPVWCHWIDESAYRAIADPVDYSRSSRPP